MPMQYADWEQWFFVHARLRNCLGPQYRAALSLPGSRFVMMPRENSYLRLRSNIMIDPKAVQYILAREWNMYTLFLIQYFGDHAECAVEPLIMIGELANNGVYYTETHTIVISSKLRGHELHKTVVHELVHAVQHAQGNSFDCSLPYEDRPHEIEAERKTLSILATMRLMAICYNCNELRARTEMQDTDIGCRCASCRQTQEKEYAMDI